MLVFIVTLSLYQSHVLLIIIYVSQRKGKKIRILSNNAFPQRHTSLLPSYLWGTLERGSIAAHGQDFSRGDERRWNSLVKLRETRDEKQKKKEKHRGIRWENSTRDDSTTVSRYGPSGRPWVTHPQPSETDRNGVRAFRSRFRVPRGPRVGVVAPLRGRRGAENSSLPFVGGRRAIDVSLASPPPPAAPAYVSLQRNRAQPPLAIYRYIFSLSPHHRHQTLLNIVVSVRASLRRTLTSSACLEFPRDYAVINCFR